MSKWNRPMTTYQAPKLACRHCGKPVKPSQFGGWIHKEFIRITCPDWHVAEVA